MKEFFKGKLSTILILTATFVLAGVAIYTAVRLYQLRQVPVSPNVPESNPQAGNNQTTLACSLSFTLSVSTPSPSPSPSPSPAGSHTPTPTPTKSPTPSPSASPSPVPQCNNNCTSNSECPSGLVCSIATNATVGNCRNPSCTEDSDCICTTSTPTPTPTITPPGTTPAPTPTPTLIASSTPTPAPTQVILPESGTGWVTYVGIAIGIITLIGSFVLAL